MTTADRIAQNRRIVANRLYADTYRPLVGENGPFSKQLLAFWTEHHSAADYALDATIRSVSA